MNYYTKYFPKKILIKKLQLAEKAENWAEKCLSLKNIINSKFVMLPCTISSKIIEIENSLILFMVYKIY